METKKTAKEVAKLEIICTNDDNCAVKINGDRNRIIVALATLLVNTDKNNSFHDMIDTAITLILAESKESKKKPVVKKAAPKKAVKKAASKKK
jgi:hypothetical protein